MDKIRVLLVDENDDFLDGLSAWMARRPEVNVVGVAHSAAEAMERTERLRPDLLVVDMSLPDMSGLDAMRSIKSRDGAPLVYLMTFHDSMAFRMEARAAGADGALSKTRITREFLPALRPLLRARAADAAVGGEPRIAAPLQKGLPPEVRK